MKKLLSLITLCALTTVISLSAQEALDDVWHKLKREYFETGRINAEYAAEFKKLRDEGEKFEKMHPMKHEGEYDSTKRQRFENLLKALGMTREEFHNLHEK